MIIFTLYPHKGQKLKDHLSDEIHFPLHMQHFVINSAGLKARKPYVGLSLHFTELCVQLILQMISGSQHLRVVCVTIYLDPWPEGSSVLTRVMPSAELMLALLHHRFSSDLHSRFGPKSHLFIVSPRRANNGRVGPIASDQEPPGQIKLCFHCWTSRCDALGIKRMLGCRISQLFWEKKLFYFSPYCPAL